MYMHMYDWGNDFAFVYMIQFWNRSDCGNSVFAFLILLKQNSTDISLGFSIE
jgi:hypothetical protein